MRGTAIRREAVAVMPDRREGGGITVTEPVVLGEL